MTMAPYNGLTPLSNTSGVTMPDLEISPLQSPTSENSSSELQPEPEPATSLEHLQTEKQREFLEAIVSLRKHGVDNVVSLPQVVVCGAQSAGKSSVLEAITGIPFPRNDNLCTRFATEINLLYAVTNSITISINPDTDRPKPEKERIAKFERVITNFQELPAIMKEAMTEMGISTDDESDVEEAQSQPFSRDVLSIEYKGQGRPQLTVVDLPGLIGTVTKKTTMADLELVREITQKYIEQSRTIILPVVTAIEDLANHNILTRSRDVDPDGQRTLGIITKPDRAVPNSAGEASYIDLVLNNDEVHLDLGWHVVKNRKLDETDATLKERNSSEAAFFRKSNWSRLPKDRVGIDSLVIRLSQVLFEHIKRELPNLRKEIESKLDKTRQELKQLGKSRSSGPDCKAYLAELSLEYHEICKAAVDGHYEGKYFTSADDDFSSSSQSPVSRTRAVVQSLNSSFADSVRLNGQKYRIDMSSEGDDDAVDSEFFGCDDRSESDESPTILTKHQALLWVNRALRRNRGKELVGNFNPLLIGELYWELSEKWEVLAIDHVEEVADACEKFLKDLLTDKCPKDVETRIWDSKILDELKNRREGASKELNMLLEDNRSYPINYNHYYTDTITKRRTKRQQSALLRCMESATTTNVDRHNQHHEQVDVEKAAADYAKQTDPNMDNFGCEEILDCLFAIYKVQQKTFVANVTTQVIERHIVRGLEKIFSPIFVSSLEYVEAQELACEPSGIQTKRAYLEDQIRKLEDGRKAFRKVMI